MNIQDSTQAVMVPGPDRLVSTLPMEHDEVLRKGKSEIRQSSWWQSVKLWWKVKQLERDIRESKNFQRMCEQSKCPTLALLEAEHRARIEKKILQLTKAKD